jgi:hypothetical protein
MFEENTNMVSTYTYQPKQLQDNDSRFSRRCIGISILWDMMPCNLVERYHTYCLHPQGRTASMDIGKSGSGPARLTPLVCRWREQVSPERCYQTNRLHGVASQTFVIFTMKLFPDESICINLDKFPFEVLGLLWYPLP